VADPVKCLLLLSFSSCVSMGSASRVSRGSSAFYYSPADIHAVETVDEDAVSLHVYVKPYDECDIYDVARGEVRRVRLTYDSVPEHPVAP
jgi:hypothetical protein